MTDKLNRVELDSTECEEVVGGALVWPRNTIKNYDECFDPSHPEVRYRCVHDTTECQMYEKLNRSMKKMNNQQKIATFLEMGWIVPAN